MFSLRSGKQVASKAVVSPEQISMGRFEDNLLWHEAGLGFITVPKTGNTSVKLALTQALSPLDAEQQRVLRRDAQAIHRLLRATPLRVNKPRLAQCRDGLVFSIVRNPWARIVSFHSDKILGRGWSRPMLQKLEAVYGICHGDSLAKMLAALSNVPDHAAEIHFRSQCSLLHWNGMLLPHAVLRFESLDSGWDVVREYLREAARMDVGKLPHTNATSETHYRDVLGRREKDLIFKRYRQDIELFEYEY